MSEQHKPFYTVSEIHVNQSLGDVGNFAGFDGLSGGLRQVYKCVYEWNGSTYVNNTAKFPDDARAVESDAQAKYLQHWQENPTADYNNTDDQLLDEDKADRADAIEYWANAMAIGDGDTAKAWLLNHANPRLASHLLQIEGDLQKQITPQGQPLDLQMGDGKNLDQIASVSPGERDPLKETAANGSGQNDAILDIATLQHKIVTEDDLTGKSLAALSVSYNTIYADHGYIFSRTSLQRLFNHAQWYKPNPNFHEQDLTGIEKANLKTIRDYERRQYGY